MVDRVEFALSLIKAELQNLKLISDLNRTGIDASTHLLDFSTLILEIMGFDHDTTDHFYEWYSHRQRMLVENVDADDDKAFLERAFNFYVDLAIKKRDLDRGPRNYRL